MSLNSLVLFIILSGVVYRVTRLAVEDILFDAPRAWVQAHLVKGPEVRLWDDHDLRDREFRSLAKQAGGWRKKLYQLTSCPYCASAYVSAGAVALTLCFRPVELPVWMWLASWSGGLIFYTIAE